MTETTTEIVKDMEIVTDEPDVYCKEIFVFKDECKNMCGGKHEEESIVGPFIATLTCPECKDDFVDKEGNKVMFRYCCICDKPCKEGCCKFVDSVLFDYGYLQPFRATIRIDTTENVKLQLSSETKE